MRSGEATPTPPAQAEVEASRALVVMVVLLFIYERAHFDRRQLIYYSSKRNTTTKYEPQMHDACCGACSADLCICN